MDMDSLWPIAAYEMKPDDDEKNKVVHLGWSGFSPVDGVGLVQWMGWV